MPIPREGFDRTVAIGHEPVVTVRGRTRLDIESRYGQFRGHWWWNKGWVYVSGQVLPGSRIHLHIDRRSLTLTESPGAQAVAEVGRYGPKVSIGDFINVDVIRFGIGGVMFANRTSGGPFPRRHVVDQLEARAWSGRGLTITRDQVISSPADQIPCPGTQPSANGWTWGCRLLGQPPLRSDRRGPFPSGPEPPVNADGISLTPTPTPRTQLPQDSMRITW
jgi:hypothetical protein